MTGFQASCKLGIERSEESFIRALSRFDALAKFFVLSCDVDTAFVRY